MKVFVAGSSGAIGQPLIAELIRQGHTVTGMSRSEAGTKNLVDIGAAAAVVDAFDELAVERALRGSQAEVVIDELTSLPRDPSQIAEAFPGDRKLRLEGGANLHRAAQRAGVRRYIQQASGFFLKGGAGLADESSPLATDASAGVAASAQMYAEIESRLRNSGEMEGIALLEDAALATVAALTVPAGIYNVVDNDPLPVSRWLPEFARWLGAPPPPKVTEQDAREAAGDDAVYYDTKLSGSSNTKAKRSFGFRPRRLQWLS